MLPRFVEEDDFWAEVDCRWLYSILLLFSGVGDDCPLFVDDGVVNGGVHGAEMHTPPVAVAI